MSKRTAWLILALFALTLVWVVYDEITRAHAAGRLSQTLLATLFVLLAGAGMIAIFAGLFWLTDTFRRRVRESSPRLPPGITREEILRHAPYEIYWEQGYENRREVRDKQTGEMVFSADSDAQAETWIIRQWLKEQHPAHTAARRL